MRTLSVENVGQKKGWTLTPGAFRKLLDWLGEGIDSGGQSYLDMRRRLVAYFDRKNCVAPDDLADETLNRVARRLEEEGTITGDTSAHYCYIVARYVLLEYWRGERRCEVPLDTAIKQSADKSFPVSEWEEAESLEKLMRCLDRCAEKLEPLSRDLITRYYLGERRAKIENRRALAAEMGMTMNALSIRACRIRDKLEACVENCVGAR
ncbi:MAG: hypothetical protein M3R15_25250 [Acidobacteriota bacterium]|nr:hypothetical protein [Acidobacteriota bacterium]